MAKRIERSPQAKRDVFDIATYLTLEASQDVAERFVDALQQALGDLLDQPGMGSPRWQWAHAKLAGIRHWPVPGFPNHLIFYRETEIGIDVVRVLHGARDIPDVMTEESS